MHVQTVSTRLLLEGGGGEGGRGLETRLGINHAML